MFALPPGVLMDKITLIVASIFATVCRHFVLQDKWLGCTSGATTQAEARTDAAKIALDKARQQLLEAERELEQAQKAQAETAQCVSFPLRSVECQADS